ncbi:MAG: DNA-binding protein [Thermoplasmatota archaeon]
MDTEDIKRRMMQEIQQQQQEEQQEAQEEYVQAQKKALMRQILTPKARERLGRIRVAQPQRAEMIENQLIRLYQMGRIQEKLDDEQFQEVIKRLTPKKRDINIRRK